VHAGLDHGRVEDADHTKKAGNKCCARKLQQHAAQQPEDQQERRLGEQEGRSWRLGVGVEHGRGWGGGDASSRSGGSGSSGGDGGGSTLSWLQRRLQGLVIYPNMLRAAGEGSATLGISQFPLYDTWVSGPSPLPLHGMRAGELYDLPPGLLPPGLRLVLGPRLRLRPTMLAWRLGACR